MITLSNDVADLVVIFTRLDQIPTLYICVERIADEPDRCRINGGAVEIPYEIAVRCARFAKTRTKTAQYDNEGSNCDVGPGTLTEADAEAFVGVFTDRKA